MKLFVHREFNQVTNVWAEDVPQDFTDEDVRWNVQNWADAGDTVAKMAVEAITGMWISYGLLMHKEPNLRPTVRVYMDEY